MIRYLSIEKRTILLFIVPFLVLLFFNTIANPMYESNDDMGIIAILSGRMGYPASTDTVFMSSILGMVLSSFYESLPQVPWYSIMLYVLQIFALFMGINIIISIFYTNFFHPFRDFLTSSYKIFCRIWILNKLFIYKLSSQHAFLILCNLIKA